MSIEAGTYQYQLDEKAEKVILTTRGKRIQGEEDPDSVEIILTKEQIASLPQTTLAERVQNTSGESDSVFHDMIVFMWFGFTVLLEKRVSDEGAWAGRDMDFSGPFLLRPNS